MHDRRFHVAVATLALTVLLAGSIGPALAQAETSGAADAQAAAWRAQLGQAHQMLADEQYQQARDLTVTLADDMMRNLGAGSEATYTMAVVAAFRAIAEVGLGHRDDGLWYWRIATTLHPAFAQRDLSVYGEPAVWLTSQAFRGGYQAPAMGEDLMEPRPDQNPAVALPESIADLETNDVEIVAEVVVGRDGKPREPRIVAAPEVPSVVYAVLEGIKNWTFVPAMNDGKPVPMTQQVAIPLGG